MLTMIIYLYTLTLLHTWQINHIVHQFATQTVGVNLITRRHSGRDVQMCVSNMKLDLFTEIEAKEACDWLKAAGFPQYAQLYEGKTVSQMILFSSFLFPILYPSILISPIVWPAAVYFQASALVQRWVMGKAYLLLLGLVILFSIFFHLSPLTLSTVPPLPY